MTTTRQQAAAAFFRARLEFQTDVSDVHAALTAQRSANGAAQPAGVQRKAAADEGAQRSLDQGPTGSPAQRPAFVLVDSRSRAAWEQAHIPGAVHLPTADIAVRAAALLDPGVPVVTYCWGPGCNGATRAALAFCEAGFDAREMIGGIEYWIREGFPVRTGNGEEISEPDPLTAEAACGC